MTHSSDPPRPPEPPLPGSPNRLEALLRKIPGFRGYLEREHRRKADQLQRQYLADQLQRFKGVLDRAALKLTEAGRIDCLPVLERCRSRLDRLIGSIRGAVHGYSGFFDLIQVDQQMLDRVYEHDYQMIEQVEAIGRAVEQLAKGEQTSDQAELGLTTAIDQAQRYWDARREILEGLK